MIVAEIRDGSGSSGGVGALSLFHHMGIYRTVLLVEQLFRGPQLGFNIQVGIKNLALDTGRYGPLWLMHSPILSKYIDRRSWVYAVIEYNHRHNIKISAKHKIFEEQRIGDTAIMTVAFRFFKKCN